jgi:hypothetical protein
MKSFPTDIKLHGLRLDKSNPKNDGFALDCRGVRGRKHGLEGYSPEIMNMPSIVYGGGTLSMSYDWPFPQIFQTDTGLFIGKRDGLYKVTFVAGVLTATKVTTLYSGFVNWPWTLANCPGFPVFTSGDLLVYYDYSNTAWVAFNKATIGSTGGTHWDATWDQPVAACFFEGQIIVCGGTDSTTFPSNSRIVRWSEVGAFRFLGKTASTVANTAGFAFAPTDDYEILLRCLKLGKKVIVYGTFSCFEMRPVSDPVPAFGIKHLRHVGIRNPLAVGGSDSLHILVDREGYMWRVALDNYGNAQVEKIGYSEYFAVAQKDHSIATGEGLVSVVYNDGEEEFYIGNGIDSFLYREGELTRINKCITSIVSYKNAVVTDSSDLDYINTLPIGCYSQVDDNTIIYQSDVFDQGMSGIKLIETVEVLGSFSVDSPVEVMVETRSDRSQPFRSTKWIRCDKNGACSPTVQGTELRVNVRISNWKDCTIEALRLWWKVTDRRYVRGRYDDNISYNRGKG